MGAKTRGGLTKAAYREDRRRKVEKGAQAPMTRAQHESLRRALAAEWAAQKDRPKHNTICGNGKPAPSADPNAKRVVVIPALAAPASRRDGKPAAEERPALIIVIDPAITAVSIAATPAPLG